MASRGDDQDLRGEAQADAEITDAEDDDIADTLAEDHEAVTFAAINLYLPRFAPSGVVALTNATIISMGEAGVIEDGVVVVRNDRIEAVGRLGDVAIPPIIQCRITAGAADCFAQFSLNAEYCYCWFFTPYVMNGLRQQITKLFWF